MWWTRRAEPSPSEAILSKGKGYKVRVFNSIDFSKSMHYNPLAYIKTESDVLKFVNALIANTKGEGKEGDPFWTKAETLLYCALVAYIVFEGPEEERNMNTLVEMINQHGGAGGRRILQERRGLHVRRPRQKEPPELRRAPVCQIQAGQR